MTTPDHYPSHESNDWQPGRTAVRSSNGLAVAALVLGILAVVFFWTVIGGILLGVIGLVLGIFGIRRASAGKAPRRGMAITGTVLSVLGILGGAGILIAGISILNSDSFKSYSDCVHHADSQSEKDQCARDFNHQLGN
ncbi:DUF4190 domain-containing protein [Streptomyces sp. NPDC051322]|uniref:DUF4190 domain-containing protein n=1 Tax=Streptomyces sp. NPDC051322 TaxID=3154645 RepID=UPI00344C7B94